ncbi:2-dehydro-3-deoxygluconokinase [Roseibium aquae]|uniref:2-dehydro-3-deoxygluconokinase n=1 Tax=Roseibium aquae TaxID=1323746 RepID=A0A916TJM2_9HYPH|nr:sugar kinase [Roseibium aquae]GGB46563.1 2-dehydro-3-deoxygluconokinase [Roseibium aquae]
MKRFVALGECMVELSPASVNEYALGFAGDTFNTAWYARQLASPDKLSVAYFSAVGDDDISRRMTDFMREAGIEPMVERVPRTSVGLYLISLTDGERSFQYWRDTSAARRLHLYLDRFPHLGSGDVAYFSGITMAILPDEGRARVLDTLRSCAGHGALVVFDPNLRPRLWSSEAEMTRWTMKAAAEADLVLPSFADEAQHFQDVDPAATACRYLDNGAGIVVVKNGDEPVLVETRDGEHVEVQPAPAGVVVDTTAAGDSFNAAFIVEFGQGKGLAAAARAGCELARHVIGRKGALIPTGQRDPDGAKVLIEG